MSKPGCTLHRQGSAAVLLIELGGDRHGIANHGQSSRIRAFDSTAETQPAPLLVGLTSAIVLFLRPRVRH